MIDIKAVTKDNLEPLHKVLSILDGTLPAEELEGMTALELSCWLKRAESFVECMRSRVRLQANDEFAAMRKANEEQKQWPIQSIAMVTTYTPRCSWEYPKELVKESEELAAKLKAAQKDETAKKHTPKPNPAASSLFAINLTDNSF